MAALSFTTVSAMLVTLPGVSSSTNATSAQLAVFAERAESVMNAKLAKRYALPFVVAPPVLQTIATELAVYNFLTRRVFTQEKQNRSEWPDRYKEAMDLLDEIVSGEFPLIDAAGVVIGATTSQIQIWSNTMWFRPTMTEDDAESQFVDPDKLEQIRRDRNQFVDVLDAGPVR